MPGTNVPKIGPDWGTWLLGNRAVSSFGSNVPKFQWPVRSGTLAKQRRTEVFVQSLSISVGRSSEALGMSPNGISSRD